VEIRPTDPTHFDVDANVRLADRYLVDIVYANISAVVKSCYSH